MIITAIVRVSAIRLNKPFDLVWDIFWLEVEAAIAVIMVSITAFRSLLGIKALKAREKKDQSWFDRYHPKLLARHLKKSTENESDLAELPSIPGAALTGMRTFIHGAGVCEDPDATIHEPHKIKITHQFSTETEILNGPMPVYIANFI